MAHTAQPAPGTEFSLGLTPAELKITYTALRSLLDDYGHEEQDLCHVVNRVLAKLPDRADIDAIDLRSALRAEREAA
jgi:hypothetical protein